MASDLLSFKCPGCGGALTYDAESEKFLCPFCSGVFDFETVKNADVNADKPFDWGDYNQNVGSETLEGTVSYVCKSCGAEIVTDAVTAATRCPYCDNVIVVEPNVSGFIKPNGIIPFKIDKKRLSDLLKNFCKGKKLLPRKYVDENRINEVRGIYVPFWLFDCTADGSVTYETTTTEFWSDREYDYRKTNYFFATVDGGAAFSKIPVDGSIKTDDALMDSIEPFDYTELKEFAPGYLSGFSADRFDADAESCLPRADARVKQSIDDVFRQELIGFDTVMRLSSNVNLIDTDVKYVLLPVYLISTKYKEKIYRFAVNGQTGKVSGDLPVSVGKFFLWLFGITGVLSVIIFFIIKLITGGGL